MSIAVLGLEPVRSSATIGTTQKIDGCHSCPARTRSICGALKQDELGCLASIKGTQRVAAGETFLGEGEPASHFLNIVDGAVKVFKLLPDGRRQITGFLFAGDLLGLAFNESYTYSAEALTPVSLCRFSRGPFERLLDRFPGMERRLLAMASNELAAAQEQMILLGRKTAQEKVASFLLSLVQREERLGRGGEQVKLPMTRTDIADYLGLTTETTSRVFTRLRKLKTIELEATDTVRILDLDALEDIAAGGEE